MKVLAVYPYIPYPPDRGAYHRAFHLLRALAEQHQLDLIALAENGEGTEFKPVFEAICRHVHILPFRHPPWAKLIPKRLLNPLPATVAHWSLSAVRRFIQECLHTNRYDAVHLFDIVLAQYFLAQKHDWVLVTDRTRVDLQYQLMEYRRMRFSLRQRALHWENLMKLWLYERAVARRAKLEIVCGPDDEQFVRRIIRRNIPLAIIPNGVDLDYFYPDAVPEAKRAATPTLLFCGAMDYNPNIDALRWYFSEIHDKVRSRVPDVQLRIVGKNPTSEIRALADQPGVQVTGSVPDVRPYYRQAWVQIVPVRIGGGTRLKIVESLAMETPVVSTTIGAQGLNLQDEYDVLFADQAEPFAIQVCRVLRDHSLHHNLARTGLETVRRRLSWKTLGQKLCQIYERILPMASGREARGERRGLHRNV